MIHPCHPAPPCWQQEHSKPSQAQLRSSQQPHLTFHPPAPERANRQDLGEIKPRGKSKAASPLEMLVEPKPVASSGSRSPLTSPRSWTGPRTPCLMSSITHSWEALNIPRASPAFLLALGQQHPGRWKAQGWHCGAAPLPPLSLGSNRDTPGGI